MIDLEFVRGLIQAVDQSGIDSLEVTRAGTRIRIAKTPPAAAAAQATAPALSAQQAAGPPPPPLAAAAEPQPVAPKAQGDGLSDIRSPMVGTFYRSASPESPPFVEVGSRVAKGQPLCILEAMKLMNELESEVAGVVREILVENAEPVEYGQVLFRIEPLP
jgi:acetyl-CoA carboxylase biotin carboxyl carrier protein